MSPTTTVSVQFKYIKGETGRWSLPFPFYLRWWSQRQGRSNNPVYPLTTVRFMFETRLFFRLGGPGPDRHRYGGCSAGTETPRLPGFKGLHIHSLATIEAYTMHISPQAWRDQGVDFPGSDNLGCRMGTRSPGSFPLRAFFRSHSWERN